MPSSKNTGRSIANALLLKPLSAVYGGITAVRNRMFDSGILQQREFDIPILVVGNISVGGTGKTPHTEYLIEALCRQYNIGVLSRGYNRRTKGFVLADDGSDAAAIGDEPLQMYRKFSGRGVHVAVCEDRARGIDRLRELYPDINLMILDDAFQHRYVKPRCAVVLTEYSRPVFEDSMLPAGRLRENISALHRADIVVVTKCPPEMKQLEYRLFLKHLDLYPYQKLYFSRYSYLPPVPVFPDAASPLPSLDALQPGHSIVAVTGIAHPLSFVKYLRSFRAKVKGMVYPDHHNYTLDDIRDILRKVKSLGVPKNTIIVTTEKDAMRIQSLPDLPKSLRCRLYYIPIGVEMINVDPADPGLVANVLQSIK